MTGKLILVWGWLAIYLLLFYLSPLSSAAGLSGMVRRWQLWDALFLADEVCPRWIEDCSWHSLSQRAMILALAGAIFCGAWACGWLLLQLAGVNRRVTRLESFVFAAGVGLNIVSLAMLALGLCGVLHVGAFAVPGMAALTVAGLLGWRQFRGRRSRAKSSVQQLESPATDDGAPALDRKWLLLAVPFVLMIVLGALLPPADFDVREYHLQAPKEFYQAGRITFLPHNIYANMPLGAEMLALLGMVTAGDWWTGALVGKTLIAAYAPLTALALLAAGRRFVTPAAGIVAALVYISIPWIALVSMQGLVEGAYAFYLFTALYGVLLWRQQASAGEHSNSLLALAGFLAGGAVSCKYPAVLFCVLPLTAWIAWRSVARARSPVTARFTRLAAAKPIVVFLCFTALGCGLWFAKNAVLTGNPTYPLLTSVFDGQTRTPDKDRQWTRAHRPPNFRISDLAERAADTTVRSDWLSPLLVPFAALALMGARARRLAWVLAAYWLFVFLAWWLFTHRLDRFWIPILAVVALLAGTGAVWTSNRWWRWTLAGLLPLGLLYNFVVITGGSLGDNRYLADLDHLRVDPERVARWHLYLKEHARHVTGVLMVGDAQPFDLEVPALYNTVFDDSIFEQLARGRTPGEIQAELQARKISHVFVAWNEIRRYRSPGNYGITDFLQPEVFQRLVAAGVLAELPPLAGDAGQMFRVEGLR